MKAVTVGYVGMTHLGLNSAAAAAEKGFKTIGYDPNKELIARLSKGHLPVVEPLLPELIQKNRDHFTFSSDLSDLDNCDLLYIAPDIPTNDLGQSDLNSICSLIDLIGNHKAIVVILSQVPPGFTRSIKRDLSQTFYQVETLIFGQAVERALKPERFMIGAAHPEQPLPQKLAAFLESFGCPILPMRYESAELSKITINMFLVSSVTTANTIAELCEKIGADWAEIVPSLQLDKRIGKHAYLSAGLGISGGNLERDLTTFCSLSDLHGTDAGVVRAWQKNSYYRRNWVLRILQKAHLLRKETLFGMLGIAYKKNTTSIKNSPALDLLSSLKKASVRLFDPVIKTLPDLYPNMEMAPTPQEAYKNVDVLLIMTPWDAFKELSLPEIKQQMKGKTIIDPFAILDQKTCNELELTYYRLGT